MLRSLRLFLGVCEQASFSAVARSHHVSHTTVARAIDELEAHFGVRLLQRSTRRLALTREGEALAAHAHALIDQFDQAEAELAGSAAARGLVRVGLTSALGLHYARRLERLRARHPGLAVELLVADWRDAGDDAGLDLWLRVDEAPPPEAVPLGAAASQLVAAPAYLAREGAPATVGDLARHQCLAYGYGAQRVAWRIGGESFEPAGFLRANSSEAVRHAALGGLGIALLPRFQVAGDLAAGDLVPVLPEAAIPALPVVAMLPFPRARLPMRVRAVLAFLGDAFPQDGQEREG